jgi:hypothetical protein
LDAAKALESWALDLGASQRCITRIALGILILAGCIAVDPLGPRVCDCELLTEWFAELPLLPDGESIDEGIGASETEERLDIGAGTRISDVDEEYKQKIIEAFTDQGVSYEVRSDTAEDWTVAFAPETTTGRVGVETPWRLIVSTRSGLSIVIAIGSDASEYGIDDIDALWQGYEDDRESASAIQHQRQEAALDLLEPVQRAAEAFAQNQ